MRRKAGGESGQSLAELALVMPLLLMILVAMVEVGWAMRSHLVVTTASREAARFAARRVFSYDQIDEVAEVALLSLNPVYDGADANATIIITKVQIPAEGNWSIDGGQPYVRGDLAVETTMDSTAYNQIAADNVVFNAAHSGIDSENNVVVVEVFYDHDLLLGSRIAGDWVGLGPLRLYSRSISRIGVSRYE
jgi:Flp pilus assembly protein TadG